MKAMQPIQQAFFRAPAHGMRVRLCQYAGIEAEEPSIDGLYKRLYATYWRIVVPAFALLVLAGLIANRSTLADFTREHCSAGGGNLLTTDGRLVCQSAEASSTQQPRTSNKQDKSSALRADMRRVKSEPSRQSVVNAPLRMAIHLDLHRRSTPAVYAIPVASVQLKLTHEISIPSD